MGEVTSEKIVHFAATELRKQLMDVFCGYVAPEDDITTDPAACTCSECRDWLRPPKDDAGRLLAEGFAFFRWHEKRHTTGCRWLDRHDYCLAHWQRGLPR